MDGQEMLAVQEAISRQWRVKKKLASDMSNMKMKNHSQLSVTKIQTLEVSQKVFVIINLNFQKEPDNQEPLERIEIEHREDEPFFMPPAPVRPFYSFLSSNYYSKQRTLLHRMTLLAAAFWSRTRSNAAHFSRRAV